MTMFCPPSSDTRNSAKRRRNRKLVHCVFSYENFVSQIATLNVYDRKIIAVIVLFTVQPSACV